MSTEATDNRLAKIAEHIAADKAKYAGRPTLYTDEVADFIVEQHAEGKTLTEICKIDSMPRLNTVYDWSEKNKDFRVRLKRARKRHANAMADCMENTTADFVDDSLKSDDNRQTNDRIRAKADILRVSSAVYQWLISRANPKVYGDHSKVTQKTDAKVEVVDGEQTKSKLIDRMTALAASPAVVETVDIKQENLQDNK